MSVNGEIFAFSEIVNLLADVVLVIAPDESNDPLTAESDIEIRDQIKHMGRSTSFDPPSSPLPSFQIVGNLVLESGEWKFISYIRTDSQTFVMKVRRA